MARIRTVKPEFWGHAKTAKVSRDARLLFLALLNDADDEGRLLGSVKRLAGQVFPHDDDVGSGEIREWLGELSRARFVDLYEVDGIPYVLVRGFDEHQKVSHPSPSRLPPPPDPPDQPVSPPKTLPNDSGDAPESFAPDLGTGNREQGSGSAPAPLALVVAERPPSESFELFWSRYPARNGRKLEKAKAKAQWMKLSSAERASAGLGVEQYAASGVMAKDAYRWLRDKSWVDWIEPLKPATSYETPKVIYT